MEKATARIGKQFYRTEIKSASGNLLIADEPESNGGKNSGLSPKELLASALAACTSITLRMYIEHKQWDVQDINVEVELERNDSENKTHFTRKINFTGSITEEQKARLLAVANACPVHKILTNPIEVETSAL